MIDLKKLENIFKCMLAIIGGSLVGIGEAWILIPLKLTTGGFNGIAMMIYYIFNVPTAITTLVLNIPLFLVTIKILGFKYSFRTLLGMLSLSLMLSVATNWTPLTTDMLLAAVFGSTIIGIGIAIAIKGESTTGGTELLAKLIQTKYRHLNLGDLIFVIDGIIIAVAAFTFDSIEIALYSAISVFVMTKIIDFIIDGGKYAKAIFIISNKTKEISDYIMNDIKRGVTLIDGKGAYSGNERTILFCIANKREIPLIKDKIKEIDINSFVIVTTVSEAIGLGFEKEFEE